MPWRAVIRRIERIDRRSCAVLRMNGWRRNLQVAAGRRQFTSASLAKVAPFYVRTDFLRSTGTTGAVLEVKRKSAFKFIPMFLLVVRSRNNDHQRIGLAGMIQVRSARARTHLFFRSVGRVEHQVTGKMDNLLAVGIEDVVVRRKHVHNPRLCGARNRPDLYPDSTSAPICCSVLPWARACSVNSLV